VSITWVSYGENNPKGMLEFRTVREVPLTEIFLDERHRKRINKLASNTEVNQPFLEFIKDNQFPDGIIKRAIISFVSSFNPMGVLALEKFGGSEEKYVVGVTNEKFGGEVSRKLRLLMVREDVLRKEFHEKTFPKIPTEVATEENQLDQEWKEYFLPPDKRGKIWKPKHDGPMAYESHHYNRIKALKVMANLFYGGQPGQRYFFDTPRLPLFTGGSILGEGDGSGEPRFKKAKTS